MIEYKIAEKQVEGEEVVIERHGSVHAFTPSEVKRNVEVLGKLKRELTAQVDLEKAKMSNIEHFNPVVKELTAEQMSAVAIYLKSMSIRAESEAKLLEVEEALKEENEACEVIKEKLGVDILAPSAAAQLSADTEVSKEPVAEAQA